MRTQKNRRTLYFKPFLWGLLTLDLLSFLAEVDNY